MSGNFKELKKESFIIKDDSISVIPKVEKLTGISDNIRRKAGYPIKEVLIKFINDLANCDILVAHNIDFDINIFLAECERNGINYNIPENMIRFDTMKLGKDICQIDNGFSDFKYPKLSELYYYLFNESLNSFHNADLDVFITSKCYKENYKREGLLSLLGL